MTLTPEQKQAVARAESSPVRFEDAETHQAYVLVKADVFDRLQSLADDSRDGYALAMKVFGRDGWDDPEMDEYDALDPRRS